MSWPKRRIIAVLICFILLGIILIGIFSGDPRAPRFVPMQTQPSGPYRHMDYGWGELAPVRDGKVWIWTVPATTNARIQNFLYDLKYRRVSGELLNASPVFANREQTKLLCEGYGSLAALKWNIIRWLEKFRAGKG